MEVTDKAIAKRTERPKPEIQTLGKKTVVSTLQWNPAFMAQWILDHARHEWVPVTDIAKKVYGRNDESSRKRVRRFLTPLFHTIFNQHHEFMLRESGKNNQTIAVKVYDAKKDSDAERQTLHIKLNLMLKRGEYSLSQYESALELLESKKKAMAKDESEPRAADDPR